MSELEDLDRIIVAYPSMSYLGDDGILKLRETKHGIYELRIPYKELMMHNLPRTLYADFVPERIIIEFKRRTE